ncbi:MAG: hypothetical protein IJK01_04550 [Clostridia bacterium]|nr:hypothetical protein [Clostridia bacterium]
MARPRKKISNPASSMEQLLARAVEAYVEPYDDRDERDANLSSLRSVADQLNTTILRTRKLLITAEYYSTETSRLVQTLTNESVGIEEISEITHLKHASINSYLPYKNLAFNLDQTTVNADRHRVFRRRLKAVEELRRHMDLPDESLYLWKAIIAFENYPFKTSGRGSREGVKFTYTVSRSTGNSGRHYSGASVDGYGNEIWLVVNGEKREKSISRSTVELGYKKAREMGVVKGPKALGLPGAGSYLWPVLIRLGVCSDE